MTPAFDLPRPLFTEALGAVILIVYSLFAQSVGIQATGSLFNRLRKGSTEEFPWELLPRLQSTFTPPDFTASVARLLERLVEVQSVGWQDRLLVLPALEAPRCL